MKLHTDFEDYYDGFFSGHGETFERYSTSELSRKDRLEYLKGHGYSIPKHGQVMKMYNPLHMYDKVVVYADETARHGEGMALYSMVEAMRYFPKRYASYYMADQPAISYRHLQIGKHQFRLVYHSLTDKWRSNVGEVEIEIIDHTFERHQTIELPLFAIDFVRKNDTFYAIDFNSAPKIKGTGIENIMLPDEVVSEIMEPLVKNNGW